MNGKSTIELRKVLQSLKVSTLNEIGLLCGSPSLKSQNKSNRIDSILSNYNFYCSNFYKPLSSSSKFIEISSIDIGIKHFSYCKTLYQPEINEFKPIVVEKWDKINLDTKFGVNYKPILHLDSILDSKRYLNYITKEMLQSTNITSSDLVVMEAQRTRTSGKFSNLATLPTILKNYTFENLLINSLYPNIVMTMEPKKMMNFWIYKYVDKKDESKISSTNSKKIRKNLFINWFDKLYKLPNFKGDISKKKDVLDYLGLDNGHKIDDLIDSLFYNLTINFQFRNLSIFHDYVTNEKNLNKFVEQQNVYHLSLIQSVLDEYGIKAKM